MTKTFNKIMDTRFGVFSLAKRPDNMVLWANYADNHKGFCLKFIGLSKYSNIFKVRYTEKLPLSLNHGIDPSQAEFLFTKSPEWSYEEEARIITKPHGHHELPVGSLKNIIVGEHCDPKHVDTIQNWINECNSNILIKKAKFNNINQKLEFLTI